MVIASLLWLAGWGQSVAPPQPVQPAPDPDELIGIHLGPQLRLSQSAEHGWRFMIPNGQSTNLKRESVEVRVVRTVLDRNEPLLKPFVNSDSDIVNIPLWPDELFEGKEMMASYTARRENGLWFQSRFFGNIISFHTVSRYSEAPGQRYVVTNFQSYFWYPHLSHGPNRPLLEFFDDSGKPIADIELVNRPMTLSSILPGENDEKKYTFVTEKSPKKKVVATARGSILRYGNIDALTASVRLPVATWYRGPGVPMLDKNGTCFVMRHFPDRKIKVSEVSALYKGRRVDDNPFDSNNPDSAFCMQPLIVIFEPLPGSDNFMMSTRGYPENLQFGTQALVLQDRDHLFQFISTRHPAESGFVLGSKWEKALKENRLLIGMTMEMVDWILGQPLQKYRKDGLDYWRYLDGIPSFAVVFKNGKVFRFEESRLP
ncbi:MAG TPA: hypothetical protein PLO61_09110 [Fimbriimonadaceae bacterium]|nr:hypothetical protein [Fimbriimonadaceae bacterium]HRJ33645.1 hypothetical protein [Fimbriimonadaceae bacterium]